MFDFFKFLSKDQSSSKDIARERLKMVLMQDRNNISPRTLSLIKSDLLKAISNYIEFEEAEVSIDFTRESPQGSALVAMIPVKKIKNIGKPSPR